MPLFGNIIFHAAHAPDVGPCFFFPVVLVVLVVEAAALVAWNRKAGAGAAVACATGMNLASYLVGFLLAPYLLIGSGLVVLNPDERGYGSHSLGPAWPRLAGLAFLQAWAVGTVVELLALLPFRRVAGLNRVVVPVVVGNVASYAALYAGFAAASGGLGRG